ncbi:3569_t:CDS:1, partial [Funneliformis geosporum]
PNDVHAKRLLYPLIFLRNEVVIESDEVYRFNKYDGGFNKGVKLTLPLTQHTAKDGNVRLLLLSFSFIQNLALQ